MDDGIRTDGERSGRRFVARNTFAAHAGRRRWSPANWSAFVPSRLRRENRSFAGTGGVSAVNRPLGFRPAFLDRQTRAIYLSRFANGEPAPCHVLDGLPEELILARNAAGRVTAAKPTLVSGFVLEGRFYDRDEAARSLAAGRPGGLPVGESREGV